MNTHQTTLKLGKIFCYPSGNLVDIFNPDPSTIEFLDIANSLAKECRYGGQIKRFLSVAEHCIRVSDLVSDENRKWAFLHDAPEAYIKDLPAPLKYHEDFSFYKEVEIGLMNAICDRFGLDYEEPKEVKHFDMIVRVTEMQDLTNIPAEWYNGYEPLDINMFPMSTETAKEVYIEYGRMLGII